jgi:hypothetical protein
MRMVLRNIQSKRRSSGLLNIASITRKQVDQVMADTQRDLLKSLNSIVKDWESDVKFQARKYVKANLIAINTFPVGADKQVWEFVDKGTKPHTIKAKTSRGLRYKTGYKPKTLPNPARLASGGGISTGSWRAAKTVNHPGSKPRNFEKVLGRDYQPKFTRDTNNAFKRAAYQINKK